MSQTADQLPRGQVVSSWSCSDLPGLRKPFPRGLCCPCAFEPALVPAEVGPSPISVSSHGIDRNFMDDSCATLRRSVSDPTECLSSEARVTPQLSILKRCLSLTKLLDSRLEIFTAKVRFSNRCNMLGSERTRLGCKRCHGACGKPGMHQGSRTGYGNCSLPHDPSCPGGVLEVPGKIAGCPTGYVPGMEHPESAVVPKGKNGNTDDDSDGSQGSFSTQLSADLETDTQNDAGDSDLNLLGQDQFGDKLILKDDIQNKLPGLPLSSLDNTMMNGLNRVSLDNVPFHYQQVSLPAISFPSVVSTAASGIPTTSPSYTSLASSQTLLTSGSTDAPRSSTSHCPPTSQLVTPPAQAQSAPGLGSGQGDTQILMNFIKQQMADVKLQMKTEFNQILAQRDSQHQAQQSAQIDAAHPQISAPQGHSTGAIRRVQFNAQLGGVQDDAEELRNRMQRDKQGKTLPEGLISMQGIRNTPGLTGIVEKSMQSVYNDPTLAAAPTAIPPAAATVFTASTGLPTVTSVSHPVPTNGFEWMQQQQKQLLEYQQQWQQHQQQLMNNQLAEHQAALAEQNRLLQEQLGRQFSTTLKTPSNRVARAAAEAAAVKRRSEQRNTLLQAEKEADSEVTKLKKSLEHAKRKQRELRQKVNHETSGADDDDDLLNRTITSTNSSGHNLDPEVEILTDPESGMLYERPVYIQDPATGIFRVKSSQPSAQSSHKESQASSDELGNVRRSKLDGHQRQEKKRNTHVNQPLSGSVASNPRMMQCPVPLPQQLRQSTASASRQGKSSDQQEVPKILTVSDWAKMCPTKSAPTVTMKNMNLPMYLWGRLGELRAANAGICGSLPADELEARLRHIQTVLQICMQNSVPSEFSNYGWELARCYDQQIQATMDSGCATWVGFDKEFPRTAHPGFLMEASTEVKKPVQKKEQKKVDGNETGNNKKVCNVFNSCMQRKKCQHEVDNPAAGRCKMRHECSHCKKEHNKSAFHQIWWCSYGGKEVHEAANGH